MKQKVLIFLLTLFTVSYGYSQNTVSGKVTANDGNGIQPLPGVSIQIVGTTNGAVTDLDGNYSLEAPENAELKFSFIGYSTQTIPVNGRSVIDVEMMEDIATLSEVVVVGYGTVKKSDLTGSVSSIKGEELVTVPTVNPVDALQGKVAGVQITNSSGAPGSSPNVRIRGVGTSGDPSPIYVVDGVILNDISFLNSKDIESMQVLKDASALAIYGNRGANGVIIITTKLGKKGEAASISVNSDFGIQVQQNRIDLLNGRQFAEVVNAINPGTYNNLDVLPNTDWQELIFEPAPVQNHQVSISGASETNQYFFSLGYFDQSGTLPESRYQRITMKLNDKYSPKEYFSLGTNLTISPFERNNTINNAPFNAYRAWPIIEPYTESGDFNVVPSVGNILADLAYNTDNVTRGFTTVGQVYGEVNFLDGFKLKSSLGVELFLEENESFVPVFAVGQSQQQNPESRFTKNNFRRSSIIWENTLNYDKQIGKSQINAVVGYTVQEVSNERFNITARNLIRDGKDFRYINPGNIDPATIENGIRDINDFYNQISYLARFNYSYDNRYIATLTYRRDGSSKFLGDNKYGDFPAVGLGWNIINEDFINFPNVITNMKLRGSWGRVGNDKIDYLAAYNVVNNNLNGVFGSPEQLYFGQSDAGFGNPDLRWEIVEQINIGLELGFYQERLTAELDFYNRDTDGFLVNLPVPAYLGNGTDLVFYNAGKVRNRGFEFNINWQDEIGDFTYYVGFNGATLKNEVLEVSGLEGSDELLGNINNNVISRTVAGLPIGAFYGYQVEGVFQNTDEIAGRPTFAGTQPGDLIFADTNDDGVLNGDDRTFIGSPIPDFNYGINLGGTYKSFGLDLLFQGQEGNEILNYKETVRPDRYNFEAHVYDYWRGEGTSNTEPRPTDGGNNYRVSSQYIQDGSFLRLRTVTLSYNLPSTLMENIGLNTARVYLRGNNIFTITDFTGYNPEVPGGTLINGVDQGTYPVSSVYSVGVNLTF
ncbi:SusC/RagA family TonB-linked outer membrane protein [Marivirga lumbricoides]|uniref:SusC/RagA family TonB-linked outer membrane protein n=1 Tax=Marivirga lumbricoides TaxID=1046115 RepID=A0ABQ1MJK2_9BACT|nr:SusC/RagA family TonB-linked outer membrane protein [Marivirga lumbricoides]